MSPTAFRSASCRATGVGPGSSCTNAWPTAARAAAARRSSTHSATGADNSSSITVGGGNGVTDALFLAGSLAVTGWLVVVGAAEVRGART